MGDKEFIMRRREADLRRLQKFHDAGGLKAFKDTVKDPTVRVLPMSRMYPVLGTKVALIQVGLRYMESMGVPSQIAREYSRAFGYEGGLAWNIEQYERCLEEKWGAETPHLTEERFRKELRLGEPQLSRPGYDAGPGIFNLSFEKQVVLLRAALKACAMADLAGEELEREFPRYFGKAGTCAFYTEDYKAKQLSRRERTRG